MKQPFFSIIVPVYKVEAYLKKCVNSIWRQTFKDYELILVDDGSPDDCPLICDELASEDDRIKVIHKNNGGLSSARNAGLDVATGGYVLFIDSDDYWCDNTFLESLYARQLEFKEDIILFGCKIIKENGDEEVTRSIYNLGILNLHDKATTLDCLFNSGNMPGSAWIFSVNRNLIEVNNLRFKVGVTAEDFEWIVSTIVLSNAVGAIDGVHYAYVRRGGSITTQVKFSAIQGAINAFEKYYELGVFFAALNKFLSRVYLLAVMSYNKLSCDDKQKAKPLLRLYLSVLKESNQNVYYWFVKIFGLRLSSFAIRKAYTLVR